MSIHSNSLWIHLDCALAGRISRRPVVLELHDLVRPGLGRRVLRAAVRLASRTVAVSRAVADTVGPAAGGLRVIPQAVDTERFHPGPPDASWRARLSSRPDQPIIGVVGRVDPEKGITTVVQAMAMLAGPAGRSHLAVVGAPALDDGTYEAALRVEASDLLGDRQRFVGPVEEVPAVLRALDVLVNASASEPFGLSVLEAQASGVPVIGTDAGGIPEFVTDGETGLLVAPGRPEALAAGLSRIFDEPGLRHDLVVAARSAAVAQHALAVRADALAGIYREVAVPVTGGDAVRTLMVTKFLPLPDDNGGRQRSLAIARRLAGLGELVLCAYDDGSADRSGLRDLGVDVRAVPWRLTPVQVARGVTAARSVSAGRFWSSPMVKTIRGVADEKEIDLLQVEYQQSVPLVRNIAAKRSILDLHNVESALVASYARARGRPRRGAPSSRGGRAAPHGASDDRPVRSRGRGQRPGADETDDPGPFRSGLPQREGAVGRAARLVGGHRGVRGHHGVGSQRRRGRLARARDLAEVVARVPDARLLLVGKDPAPAVRALAGERSRSRGRWPMCARSWPEPGLSWRRSGPAGGRG